MGKNNEWNGENTVTRGLQWTQRAGERISCLREKSKPGEGLLRAAAAWLAELSTFHLKPAEFLVRAAYTESDPVPQASGKPVLCCASPTVRTCFGFSFRRPRMVL